MSIAAKEIRSADLRGGLKNWVGVVQRLVGPAHFGRVLQLQGALSVGDKARLAMLLQPDVSVVVDSGDPDVPTIRVIRGISDAVTFLLHAMNVPPGLELHTRSVNGQAGLVVEHDDKAVAVIAVDFDGQGASVFWVRLQPVPLTHGIAAWPPTS
jgi:hypothetical protein